jgi:hypothetical protein
MLTAGHEIVAVVHTPVEGHGKFVVLQQGEKMPLIRGNLKPLQEWEHKHEEADWNKLKPTFDEFGNITKLVSGAGEDFTMKKLMRYLRRRSLKDPTPESKMTMELLSEPFVAGRLTPGGSFSRSSPRDKHLRSLEKRRSRRRPRLQQQQKGRWRTTHAAG